MASKGAGGRLMTSEEADRKGLELGREQGEAMGRTLRHMLDEIADTGDEVRTGDYLIAFAAEEAEGMYVPDGDDLRWQEPEDENIHIEIAVRDAADGRLIPNLKVFVTITAADGKKVGTHEQPLLWHPYLYHYGRNWKLPGSGRYDLHVRFDAPAFPRHDKKNGKRFLAGGEAVFRGVELETGKE